MFLESQISTSNLPKIEIQYRYWQNRLLVLAKSPTSIGQQACRYWPTPLQVLMNFLPVGHFANTDRRFHQYW